MRALYAEYGAERYYRELGAEYRNPHEDAVGEAILEARLRWDLPLARVLDLACGSGEVTIAVEALDGCSVGCDPFTQRAFLARTGRMPLPHSFQDIAKGALREQGDYSLIVCSYALHLLEPSWFHALGSMLAFHSDKFLVLTPHKRPEFKHTRWPLVDEFVQDRTRVRYYKRS